MLKTLAAILIISSYFTTRIFADAIDLSKISLNEVQKYEAQFLADLKKENISSEELQKKYLLAAKKFSEAEEHTKAYYLLQKGFSVAEPSLEYVGMFLEYIQTMGEIKSFNPIFDKTIKAIDTKKFKTMTTDEFDLASQNIVVYMRLNNIHSSELSPPELRKILEKSSIKDSINWNDSIISARLKKYDEALKYLDSVPLVGEGDNLYKSFLQAKLGKIPKYCLSIMTFSERNQNFYFKKICTLITKSGDKKHLEEQIINSGELLEFTPLYEALKIK